MCLCADSDAQSTCTGMEEVRKTSHRKSEKTAFFSLIISTACGSMAKSVKKNIFTQQVCICAAHTNLIYASLVSQEDEQRRKREKMKGLILKDFINLRKTLKIMAAFMLLYAVLALITKDASFFTVLFTVVFALLLLNTYSSDEMSKWDGFALTMPVKRETIVQGKYVVMLLLTLGGFGLSILFSTIVNAVIKKPDILENVNGFVGAGAGIIFSYCIMIPIITKVGSEKARIFLIAVYALPVIAISFLSSAIEKGELQVPEALVHGWTTFIKNAYVIVPPVLLIALGISYVISVRIYRKKEF